ncbi:MAG: TatD family hydrolase [Arenicella sp.]|nr:TatD family hydrolase [Arenicella sp.]
MSALQFIDTHCHLDFPEFDQDRQAVLQGAKNNAVRQIIIPAVTQATWSRSIELCQQQSSCYLALGLHPVFIAQHQSTHLEKITELVKRNQAVAIGEIGLDYYLKQLDRKKQQSFFSQQLCIAKHIGLPAIIHCRKAHDDCIKMLRQHTPAGGIIHAFNGSLQQANKYIEMGFLLGFGGMLTYSRSSKLRKLAVQLPLESIVLETDAPDMTVAQHRGSRNSPEYIPYIAEALAEIRNESVAEIGATTTANAHRVFPGLEL